jgi:hypothetical protein
VVVHVVADQSALDGSSENPAVVEGNELIPAEVRRELAQSAKLQPLTVPAYFAPEPGYQPSRKLADFVRARDLTCRAPGCDRSTTRWDIDHTVPHSRRSHPRVKPEVPLPFSSLAENILGLVRPAATRWQGQLCKTHPLTGMTAGRRRVELVLGEHQLAENGGFNSRARLRFARPKLSTR